jgi:hypothetical protein
MTSRRPTVILAVVAVALAVVLVVLQLRERKRTPAEWAPLPPAMSWLRQPVPERPFEVLIDSALNFSPHRLSDVGLASKGGDDVVGQIEGQPITTVEVDQHGGGILRRASEDILAARKRAIVWLVERNALEFEAMRADQPLVEVLLQGYQTFPVPTDTDLESVAPPGGLKGADEEMRAAARTQWRLKRWAAMRYLISKAGQQAHPLRIKSPGATTASSGAAERGPDATLQFELGKRKVFREELMALAGLGELKGRSDVLDMMRLHFDQIIGENALKREAARQELPIEELYAKALKEYPPISEQQLEEYLKKEPGYLKKKDGRKLARTHLDMTREPLSRRALEERLRKSIKAEFYVGPSPDPALTFEAIRPLEIGPKDARATVVVLHSFGGRSGPGFAGLLSWLMEDFGADVRLVYVPYYPQDAALQAYRLALALHCAQEQGRFRPYFEQLRFQLTRATIGDLSKLAQQIRIDEPKFRQCLNDDRYLPIIFENRRLAERVGLPDGEPALFVNGRIVEGFGQRQNIEAALEKVLGAGTMAKARSRDGGVAPAEPRDGGVGPAATGATGATGAVASDLFLEDLRALIKAGRTVAEENKAQLRRRMTPDAGLLDRRAQMAAGVFGARKVGAAFLAYKAMTPEVKALGKEAGEAWSAYANVIEKATSTPDPEKAEALKEEVEKARKRVEAIMGKLSQEARRRGM